MILVITFYIIKKTQFFPYNLILPAHIHLIKTEDLDPTNSETYENQKKTRLYQKSKNVWHFPNNLTLRIHRRLKKKNKRT